MLHISLLVMNLTQLNRVFYFHFFGVWITIQNLFYITVFLLISHSHLLQCGSAYLIQDGWQSGGMGGQ